METVNILNKCMLNVLKEGFCLSPEDIFNFLRENETELRQMCIEHFKLQIYNGTINK